MEVEVKEVEEEVLVEEEDGVGRWGRKVVDITYCFCEGGSNGRRKGWGSGERVGE